MRCCMVGERSPALVGDKVGRRAWAMLAVLSLVNLFAAVDRYNFSLVMEPMREELGASDAQMGLLGGAAFVLCYATFSLPMARLADHGNRRVLLAGAVGVWSLFAMLNGFATNIWHAAVSRIGLGLAEAAGPPTSLSLISESFGNAKRHVAVSIFQGGAAVGALVGVPIAGLIAHSHGWRAPFIVFGILGLVVAVVVWLVVRENPARARPQERSSGKSTFMSDGRLLLKDRRFFWLFVSQLSVGIPVGVMPVWLTAFMMRKFGIDLWLGALMNALFFGAIMLVGYVGSGYLLAYVIGRTGNQSLGARLPGLVAIASVPFAIGMLLAPTFNLFVGMAAVFFLLLFSSRTAASTLALDFAPDRLRGLATALILAAVSIVGGGLAPWAVGALSDYLGGLHSNAGALEWALMAAIPLPVLISGIFLIFTSSAMVVSTEKQYLGRAECLN